jgi:integrase
MTKLYKPDDDERIFYFGKSLLEREIKNYAAKANLPPIRVHDLRHSHASMLINMGFDPLEISERLGHESVKTTLDTYSHLYPDRDQKLAGALNELRENN